jgi:tRNA(Ile2) C34 agmatinyltransferase TiaS
MIDPEQGPRPLCPKCGMRMITTGTPPAPRMLECLRCGHTEAKQPGFSSPRLSLLAG